MDFADRANQPVKNIHWVLKPDGKLPKKARFRLLIAISPDNVLDTECVPMMGKKERHAGATHQRLF